MVIAAVDDVLVHAEPGELSVGELALAFVAVLAVHETVHLLAAGGIRNLRLSMRPHLGLGGLAIDLQGELSRNRLLVLQWLPFILLTVMPLAAAPCVEAPLWRSGAVIVACLNALLSGTDIVSGLLL